MSGPPRSIPSRGGIAAGASAASLRTSPPSASAHHEGRSGNTRTGWHLRARALGAANKLVSSASAYLNNLDDGSNDGFGMPGTGGSNGAKKPSPYTEERVLVFPGFAFVQDGELTVGLEGFAYRLRPLESASRTQKLFVSAARQLASLPTLPKPPQSSTSSIPSSRNTSTSNLLYDEPLDLELSPEELNKQSQMYREKNKEAQASNIPTGSAVSGGSTAAAGPPAGGGTQSRRPHPPSAQSSLASSSELLVPYEVRRPPRKGTASSVASNASTRTAGSIATLSSSTSSSSTPATTAATARAVAYSNANLEELHENLNTRLRLFFSQKLVGRRVRVSLYLQPPSPSSTPASSASNLASTPSPSSSFASSSTSRPDILSRSSEDQRTFNQQNHQGLPHQATEGEKCIAKGTLLTELGGVFKSSLSIPWKYGSPVGRQVIIRAELLPESPEGDEGVSHKTIDSEADLQSHLAKSDEAKVTVTYAHTPLRVISDIDDTIKMTHVLAGIKSVFRNVFTRPHEELVIQGMKEWYWEMFERGVHFHFVSNSPFELFGVLREYLHAAGFPPGSIRLKEYGGGSGSLLGGLWEAAGARKRGGVEEILRTFPESRVLLVGDSGEQDLELYVSLAVQFPRQVLGIFIRDVTTPLPRKRSAASSDAQPGAQGTPGVASRTPTRSNTAHDYPVKAPQSSEDYKRDAQVGGAVCDRPALPRRTSEKEQERLLTSLAKEEAKVESRTSTGSETSTMEDLSNTLSSTLLSEVPDSDVHSPNNPLRRNSVESGLLSPLTEQGYTEVEQRVINLFSDRVNNARRALPPGIMLKFFRDGFECMEEGRKIVDGVLEGQFEDGSGKGMGRSRDGNEEGPAGRSPFSTRPSTRELQQQYLLEKKKQQQQQEERERKGKQQEDESAPSSLLDL